MQMSLSKASLIEYVHKQLVNQLPDNGSLSDLNTCVSRALERLEYCFQHTAYALNWKNSVCFFDHLNADQYTVFLYYSSNVAFAELDNVELASKLFYLNKTMHSFHCMYDTDLPDVFLVVHGAGAVLGKAKYADYFVVTHNCTVGSNFDGKQPIINKFVMMYPGSSIIGETIIGSESCVANGAFVHNEVIKSNTLIVGKSPDLTLKRNKKNRMARFFSC